MKLPRPYGRGFKLRIYKKVISLQLMDDAFYYPLAFDHASLLTLKKSFDVLLPLTSHEAESFVCNSVQVGQNVLCQSCPSFEQKLLDLDLTPITLAMSQFNKSGGGIHCLSQILTT